MALSLLHTPEGVRDIYNGECARKLAVQSRISKVFRRFGYQDIETPTFEFFDIFNKERGSVTSREMFKFFDRDNNTLVLRPDVTPAIARCVAKYYMEETIPLRLCYRERTFINNSSYQGRLKEITQTGVELIGDGSSDGDGEMVALVIESLKAAGLPEFQVEVGQVEFFRGLAEEAGMDEETQEKLRDLIENKNHFGVEELILRLEIPPRLRELFLRLPELFGGFEMLKELKETVTNARSLAAIGRLEKVQSILEDYGLAGYVSYDLGMLGQYRYYTGIIFKAYTYGTGEYIVTGGRYDRLLEQFGKNTPAVGFAIVIDQLMLALSRQEAEVPVKPVDAVVLYEPPVRQKAVRWAMELRDHGESVCLMRKQPETSLEDYREYANRNGIQDIHYLGADGSVSDTPGACGASAEGRDGS